jgi:asparagine N-glycosylation enzyme membrane subunit Stt3
VFLLVVSMSFVQIPIKQHQIAIDETTYEASVWMDDYADQRGWEYPSNYVFSRWGRSHAYNHVVNGQTRSYGFAKEHYQQFVLSRSPAGWYERLHDRVGFVVTRDLESAPPGSMQARLHRHNGSASGNASGLAHFRAVYVSDDRSLKVFTLVAGATVTGTGTPNATVTATVEVDIPGASFVYRRAVPVGADGRYQFTTPYPGRYEVGGETVTVSERAVRTGGRVNASA